MKLLIALNALCFVLFTTAAVLNALQDNLVLTAILSLSAFGWLGAGIMNYKTLKLRGQ